MTSYTHSAGRAYRILIVDDNDGDILLLREALGSAGLLYKAITFTDGEKALRYVRDDIDPERPIDLVLLDMHLTRMEGTAILAAIRGNTTLKDTPVIVLSSAISKQDRERMGTYNVARHLVKPPELDEFLALGNTVREVLAEYSDEKG